MQIVTLFLSALLFFACGEGSSDKNDNSSDPADAGGDGGTNGDSDSKTDIWGAAWNVLSQSCGTAGACHNTATDGEHGLNLPADDEDAARANAAAVADDIKEKVSSKQMPPAASGSLTDEEIQSIVDWVESL